MSSFLTSILSCFCGIFLLLPPVLLPADEGQQLNTSCFTATFYMLENYYLVAFFASFCRLNKTNSFNLNHKLVFSAIWT